MSALYEKFPYLRENEDDARTECLHAVAMAVAEQMEHFVEAWDCMSSNDGLYRDVNNAFLEFRAAWELFTKGAEPEDILKRARKIVELI